MSSSTRNLTDVPEEDAKSQISSSSPYSSTTPTASSSNVSVNLNATHRTMRKPPSIRTLGRSSSDQLPSASGSVKRVSSGSSSSTAIVANGAKTKTPRGAMSQSQIPSAPTQRYQANPRLPHDKDVEPAPSTFMYWSRAPVWGTIPMRTMRAYTVTLVDTTAWLFGGCDDKDHDGSKDIYCFDIETMQWTQIPLETYHHHVVPILQPYMTVNFLFTGTVLVQPIMTPFNVYVLDTTIRRWTRPNILPGHRPVSRRAHSAVYYKGKSGYLVEAMV